MTDPSLAGARILLIAPRFFGYDEAIAAELRRQGAHVVSLPDRPLLSPWYHAAARFAPGPISRATERLYRRRLKDLGPEPYDRVLVVNGQTVTPRLIRDLRQAHPAADFVYYLWDSLANRPGALALAALFDRAYTFEPKTAMQHGLRFRPLFFDGSSAQPDMIESEFDISFIGTAHTDRHVVIERLDAALAPGVRRLWYLYIPARWVLAAYRLTNAHFRRARAGRFRFAPLPRAESQRIFERSRAILDIEHAKQIGLTIRTFETLGAGKKLVTTNPAIVDYAFYDPEVIAVIDRRSPQIPPRFLDSDATPLPAAVRARYSIAGWIEELFARDDRSASHLKAGAWGR